MPILSKFRGTEIDKLVMGAAQKFFDHEAETVRKAGVKNVAVQVERGPVARTIVATTKLTKSDMIVLGSRGLGDMEGLLRGRCFAARGNPRKVPGAGCQIADISQFALSAWQFFCLVKIDSCRCRKFRSR